MTDPQNRQKNKDTFNPSAGSNLVQYVSNIYRIVHTFDVSVSRWLYDITQKYRLFYYLSKGIEFLSDTIALPLFFLLYSIQNNPSPFSFTAFAMSCILFCEFILKRVFHRKRPIWGNNGNGYAFPSSHSIAAAVCMGIMFALPIPGALAIFSFALLIPLNRIMLGHHYIADVIFGLSIGFAISAVWIFGLMPLALP